jgi:TonB-linked SusC/RagA family outer membrane protein
MIRKLILIMLSLTISLPVVLGQTRTITGTVKDSEGIPLPGVAVVVVNTTTGVQTGLDGSFSIMAASTDQLKFSFIGMEDQTILVGTQTVIDVVLAESQIAIDDVVVVGYGSQRKATVVGAIAQVSNQEILRGTKGTNVASALQGLMPGVIVIQGSGQRGLGQVDILVRGLSTWNNSSPLILVDGIERDMRSIDPEEIESLSVLKDASATAVFGVRGANGVILITSKRGSEGKPRLSFDTQQTMETLSRIVKPLGSYEALQMRNYAVIQQGLVSPDAWGYYTPDEILEYYRTQQYPMIYMDIDWQDLMAKKRTWSSKYNMNIRGGTKFVKYFTSLGYVTQDDMLNTEDLGTGYNPAFKYNRFNFRSNLDFDITPTTRLSVNLQGIYAENQEPNTGAIAFQSLYRGIFRKPPDQPYPVYPDGTFGDSGGQYERFGSNPYADLNMWGVSRSTRTEVNLDFLFTQDLDKLIKGLKFSARVSNDSRSITSGPDISEEGYTTKYINPAIITANPQTAADSAAFITYTIPDATAKHGYYYVDKPYGMGSESASSGSVFRQGYYNATLNYSRSFGPHRVSGLVLGNVLESATGSSFPTRRIEYVSRVTYGYDDRYLLELNGSRTGVNKFGPERRYDNFFSAAPGWVISNENFMKSNLPFINLFKVRYSYGTVGNDNVNTGSMYPYISIPGFSGSSIPFLNDAGTVVNSPYLGRIEGPVANPNLQWERAVKTNLGVEFGFFENLISGSFEYFTEHRFDMLLPSGQRLNADFVGADNPPANVGETEMKGYEAELKFTKSFNKLNTWVRLSHTYAIDNVIYKEDPDLRPDYQKAAGHRIGQNYSQINQGIAQNWDDLYTGVRWTDPSQFLPGDFRQVDYNGDGIIDANDSAPFGYATRPMNTYSLSLGINWNGLSVMALFYGIYNVTANYSLPQFDYNSPVIFDYHRQEAWIPELNQTATAAYRGLRLGGTSTGDYWLWDASYLRLKTLEVAYNFDNRNLRFLDLSGLRVYMNANNLFLWTKMPEDRENNFGDNEFYPMTKTMTFGASISF